MKKEEKEIIYLNKSNEINEGKYIEKINELNNDKIKKPRYNIFDNFKGILIFTVVFAHFLFDFSNKNLNSLARKIVVFIYSFHMQAFVFISGFLSSENSIYFYNAIKLLLIYYLFNYSLSLIMYFYKNSNINFLYPTYSYWYILSLFYWRITIKFLSSIPFIVIVSIIIHLLEGYWSCFSNILSLAKTILLFPYFLIGYKIKKTKSLDKIILWRKNNIEYIIILIFFFAFVYLIQLYFNSNNITNSTLLIGNYNEKNGIKERFIIMIISSFMILFFLLLLPNFKMPLINKWGSNSLYIYLFHRIFTIMAQIHIFSNKNYSNHIVEFSLIFTLIVLFIFSSSILTNCCNSILNLTHKHLIENKIKGKRICLMLFIFFIFLLSLKPFTILILKLKLKNKNESLSSLAAYKENFIEIINNSIRISYVGNLILLKDQVISAKNNITGKYEFDEMFKYTSKHFHESDLSIGNYEGPSAGNNTSYSTSNYNDGIPLFFNFPDEFAEAVYKSGINFVTTANNHLLDKNIEGVFRTINILEKYSISHVGSYRNNEEKNQIKLINIKGIKIAILAYTSLMNIYRIDSIYEKYKYLTRIIPKKYNKYYKQIYQEIKNDFVNAKKISADIIIVLLHMGDEYFHQTNEFQDKWNKIFSDLGADIILGSHSHALQPLQYIGNTFIANSPGNFANSYIKNDGDLSAIIDIYIHNKSKKVICASAIPIYTKEIRKQYFTSIPIYDLIKNKIIPLTLNETKRVKEIQKLSTKILVGREIGIENIKKNYFFINNSYFSFD